MAVTMVMVPEAELRQLRERAEREDAKRELVKLCQPLFDATANSAVAWRSLPRLMAVLGSLIEDVLAWSEGDVLATNLVEIDSEDALPMIPRSEEHLLNIRDLMGYVENEIAPALMDLYAEQLVANVVSFRSLQRRYRRERMKSLVVQGIVSDDEAKGLTTEELEDPWLAELIADLWKQEQADSIVRLTERVREIVTKNRKIQAAER